MIAALLFRFIVVTCLAATQSNAPLPSNPSSGFGIAGTIVDADTGAAIAHARVAASAYSHRDQYIAVSTGEDGQFAFTNLSPDKYTLRAEARGYFTQSFNQHNFSETAVVVGPNHDSGNIVFALARESSIRGAVIDEAGDAVPDAAVFLYQTGTNSGSRRTSLLQQLVANDDGSYAFPHLLAGRYFVAVSARPWYAQQHPLPSSQVASRGEPQFPGQNSGSRSEQQLSSLTNVAYRVTFYPGVTQPEDAAPIDLDPGDQFVANISLQPVPAIRFRLDSNSGSPIYSVELESRAFDGGIPVFTKAMPGPTGAVEILGVAPGHYSVQFSHTNRENSRVISSREIEVSGTGQVQPASKTQSASVGVIVRHEPGTTLPQEGFLRFRNIATDLDLPEKLAITGRLASKHNLPPAIYEVSFENTAGVYVKTVSAAGATVNGRTVQITGTSPVQLVLILAQASANVTGVALRNSQPVAGAMIVLVPADPSQNHSLFRMYETDSDGTFSLRDVASGEYTLLALAKGWDLEWQNPTALKPYLVRGQAVQVHENRTYQFKVQVQ